MSVTNHNGILVGTSKEVMQAISADIGADIFPGEEHVLTHPNARGLQQGTHVIYRAHTNSGKTYPMVITKEQPMAREFFI